MNFKVLGHRGAAGVYPEHTTLGYIKGAEMGADYIECDVQITKDLQLVCSHESWINEVCNVEDHTEFSNRIRYDLKSLLSILNSFSWY